MADRYHPTNDSGRVLPRSAGCHICRQRKVRCDGLRPACGRCAKTRIECTYGEEIKKSKITLLRDEISELRKRIQELEGGGDPSSASQQSPSLVSTPSSLVRPLSDSHSINHIDKQWFHVPGSQQLSSALESDGLQTPAFCNTEIRGRALSPDGAPAFNLLDQFLVQAIRSDASTTGLLASMRYNTSPFSRNRVGQTEHKSLDDDSPIHCPRVEAPAGLGEYVSGGLSEQIQSTIKDASSRIRQPSEPGLDSTSAKRPRTPSHIANTLIRQSSHKRARTDFGVGTLGECDPTPIAGEATPGEQQPSGNIGETSQNDHIQYPSASAVDTTEPRVQTSKAQAPDPPFRNVQCVRSNEMTSSEIFECLIEHGCLDLQASIDPNRFSSCRAAEGGFGDVWKGQLIDGTNIAVKVLRYALVRENGSKNIKRVMREIYNWSKLEHKNVHKLLGITMFQERLGMVSTWMEHGTLQRYLNQHSDINRHALCLQVAEGVAYLHGVNMIHGDLKASNILVAFDGTLKLTDFDHSIIMESSLQFSATSNVGGGTSRWMAPELVVHEVLQEKTKKTDIYALGMTFLEIMTGALPYSECLRDLQVINKLSCKKYPERSFEHFPENEEGDRIWALLTRCWGYNPADRPTADDTIISLLVLKK
ncbi:unnamed protein product [Rhizoctonia solani]|uniref:Uncharacterized protein n=1 Tax=Rhizoctonia solani TaxID=456999 RepID=A0A8H3ADA8_9AGAM|nr:unnamed protein product [Rhizoctonia solani]